MNKRIFNFNPGPATQPLEVLQEVQSEFLNFKDSGMSIVEISHRSQPYEIVHEEAKKDIKDLMGLGDDYEVLFCQGGASQHFGMIAQNFAKADKIGNYILSGSFATKAYEEAKILGNPHIAASSKENNFSYIPSQEDIQLSQNAAYLHICHNNTIYGTQYQYTPEIGEIPLIADMSSDMLSRPMDFSKFSFIYAGAQKNLGPAGLVVVVAKKDFILESPKSLPTMMRYNTFLKKDSLYNTPPVFCIYFLGKVVRWIKEHGGLSQMEIINNKKAKIVYEAIDLSDGFYIGHAEKNSRSNMNITFRLENDALEAKFIEEAKAENLSGLKGHRSVGGMRASIYNAMPFEGCERLAEFMKKFAKKNR